MEPRKKFSYLLWIYRIWTQWPHWTTSLRLQAKSTAPPTTKKQICIHCPKGFKTHTCWPIEMNTKLKVSSKPVSPPDLWTPSPIPWSCTPKEKAIFRVLRYIQVLKREIFQTGPSQTSAITWHYRYSCSLNYVVQLTLLSAPRVICMRALRFQISFPTPTLCLTPELRSSRKMEWPKKSRSSNWKRQSLKRA